MSTRYVWDIYNTKTGKSLKTSPISGTTYTHYSTNTYWGAVGTGYTTDSNGNFFLTGFSWQDGKTTAINAQTFPCLTTTGSNSSASTPFSTNLFYNSNQSKFDEPLYWTFWYYSTSGTASFYRIVLMKESDKNKANSSNYTAYAQLFDHQYFEDITIQGDTKTGTVSNSSSSAYPSNGLGTTTSTQTNWYLYKGYDSIDPLSVTYNKTELNAGDSVTIKVNPTSPTYGGTISYLYQYSINGTSWTNIGSKTTSTSTSIVVPAGAKQFQVRALASDAWGFTSTTYVYGPLLGVQELKAYYGVNSKARAISKLYFGLNGKSREVTAIYFGVNGKARKVL